MNKCEQYCQTIKRMANAGGDILPAEYQQIEWIENGGNGRCYIYIDYGTMLGSNYHFAIDFEIVNDIGGALIGGDTSTSYPYPWYTVNLSSKTIAYSGQDFKFGDIAAGVRYKLEYYYDNGYYAYLNNIALTHSTASNSNNNALCVYYSQYGDYCRPTKIYKITIRDSYNGNILYNLLPCYRKADSKPGMYDIARNTFCEGRTSTQYPGTYIVGNDVLCHEYLLFYYRQLMAPPLPGQVLRIPCKRLCA